MAEPIRLIAMDMDGTLLATPPVGIPLENVAALRCAAERGVTLAICSGRMPDDAGFFAVDAGLPMHILALNGGCCLDKPLGSIVRSTYIPAEDALRLKALLSNSDFITGLFGDHTLVVSNSAEDEVELGSIWGTYINREGSRCVVRHNNEGIDDLLAHGVNKMLVATFTTDGAALLPIRRMIEDTLPGIEIASSWANNLEMNPRGVNKGMAVAALASSLGIPLSQVMTLGDNDNDVSMLSCAGYGVAMANSSPAALKAANYVTLSNNQMGVAAAIRHLVLGEKVEGVKKRS